MEITFQREIIVAGVGVECKAFVGSTKHENQQVVATIYKYHTDTSNDWYVRLIVGLKVYTYWGSPMAIGSWLFKNYHIMCFFPDARHMQEQIDEVMEYIAKHKEV